MTAPSFQSRGTTSEFNIWLKIWHIHQTVTSPVAFSILAVMLSMPGNLLLFSILMAFLKSSLLKSSVLMGRVYTGSSGLAEVAGWGQLSTSLKCSAHPASLFPASARSFPSLAFIGPDLEGTVLRFSLQCTDRSHIIVSSCFLSFLSLVIHPFSFVSLGTAFDFPVFVHLGLIGSCVD